MPQPRERPLGPVKAAEAETIPSTSPSATATSLSTSSVTIASHILPPVITKTKWGIRKRKKGYEDRKEAGEGNNAEFLSGPEGLAEKSVEKSKTVMLVTEYENEVMPALDKFGITVGDVQKFHNACTSPQC